jgi:hypothetical protein
MRRASLLVVVALAGCGGGTMTTTITKTAPLPPLPAALATQLAGEADAVAADLDGGDGCSAQTHAAQLRTDAIAAINSHAVPGPYQETLLGRIQALEAQISCTPPAPAPAAHDNGKHKGHEKKHGHGKGDD